MIPSLEGLRGIFSPWGKTDPAEHQPSISISQGEMNEWIVGVNDFNKLFEQMNDLSEFEFIAPQIAEFHTIFQCFFIFYRAGSELSAIFSV